MVYRNEKEQTPTRRRSHYPKSGEHLHEWCSAGDFRPEWILVLNPQLTKATTSTLASWSKAQWKAIIRRPVPNLLTKSTKNSKTLTNNVELMTSKSICAPALGTRKKLSALCSPYGSLTWINDKVITGASKQLRSQLRFKSRHVSLIHTKLGFGPASPNHLTFVVTQGFETCLGAPIPSTTNCVQNCGRWRWG